MRTLCFAGLCVATLMTSMPISAAKLQSVYTKITDGSDCAFEMSATEEGEDQLFECPGPVDGVGTLLHRGGDWDHLHLTIDGSRHSLWAPMIAVGTWSGLGNKKGVVEWLFASGKPRNRTRLRALIVRFEGTILGAEGDAKGTRSQLAVFDLAKGGLCWKGNYTDNAKARAAVQTVSCKAPLEPETVEVAN